MNADQLLQRARWGFRTAAAVGLLILLAGGAAEPTTPTVFFAGWQLLLLGLLGAGLTDCAEAVILEIRNGPRKPLQR